MATISGTLKCALAEEPENPVFDGDLIKGSSYLAKEVL